MGGRCAGLHRARRASKVFVCTSWFPRLNGLCVLPAALDQDSQFGAGREGPSDPPGKTRWDISASKASCLLRWHIWKACMHACSVFRLGSDRNTGSYKVKGCSYAHIRWSQWQQSGLTNPTSICISTHVGIWFTLNRTPIRCCFCCHALLATARRHQFSVFGSERNCKSH